MIELKGRPLHDRVVVLRDESDAEEVKVGSLYVPQKAQEAPTSGTVLAIGNGRILEDGTTRALDVKVGETVLFGKYSGTPIGKIPGMTEEECKGIIILREDEIL